MSNLVFVNITAWVPDQVVDWLKGLDDSLLDYVPNFINAGVTGRQLLCLCHHDLERLNIIKLGHQELILEAVNLLTTLHHELELENVQSVALRLSCKVRILKGEVKAANVQPLHVINSNVVESPLHRMPLPVLSAITDLISTLKNLVSWLDRSPFDGSEQYARKRARIVNLGMKLLEDAQGDSILHSYQAILKCCEEMVGLCEVLVTGSSDPLIIQPASLELATIKKKPEDELGLHIQSSYNGLHVIEGIKEQSPADLCGKIEEGDEVIQVNYQTVVGWQLKRLVSVLKENQKEVTMTLKKRPRHANPYGNKRKIPNKLKQSTFPKALRKSRDGSQKGGRSPLQEFLSAIPPPSEPFSESLPALPEVTNLISSHIDTSSVPDLSTVRDDSDSPLPALSDLNRSHPASSVPDLSTMRNVSCRDDNDTDNDVFASQSEALDYQLDGKHRRATVSGGSPTLKRPSIRICEFTSSGRPKSHTITVSSPSSEEGNSTGSPTSEGRVSLTSLDSSADIKHKDEVVSVTPQTSDSSASDSLDSLMRCTPSPDFHSDRSLRSATDSPKRRNASRKASKEIPGDVKGSPQLVRVVRIDSQRRPITPDRELRWESESGDSPSPTQDDRLANKMVPYSVSIVGGVPQKLPTIIRDQREASPGSPVNTFLRKRTLLKRVEAEMHNIASNRRISCKDLGNGECEGWLWKKREAPGVFVSKWVKRWFILTRHDLYFYKDPEDEKAKGRIYLPGFQVSPAPEIKSKKLAFKAHHPGTTFYFAADRQEDMGKWMNKMGLAAIVFDPTSLMALASGSPRHEHSRMENCGYYSESEDEDSPSKSQPGTPSSITPSHTPSHTPTVTPGSSREDLTESSDHLVNMVHHIRRADLTLDGADKKQKRTSAMTTADQLKVDKREAILLSRKLLSLQRTLKDKEHQFSALEILLQKEDITSSDLALLRARHPSVLSHLHDNSMSSSNSTLSVSEDDLL